MSEDQLTIQIHGIVIAPATPEVYIEGRSVRLTGAEHRLLIFLASHPGIAHTRQQIIDGTQGPDYPVTGRSIDVQVTGLRKKLGDLGRLIETVRYVGYRFAELPDRTLSIDRPRSAIG